MSATLAFGVLVLSLGPAAPGQQKPTAAHAQDLVKRLSSQKFADRERTSQALEALGEPALDALRAAARSEDPEVSQRAAAVAARIERNVTNARMLQVPTVRFKFEATPLRAVLTELNKRTGLNLQLDEQRVGNPTRPVTVDTGEAPLWAAVDKVLEAAGLADADQPSDGGASNNNSVMMPDGSVRVWTSWSGRPPAKQPNRMMLVDGKVGAAASDGAVRVRALRRDFPGNVVTKGTGEINIALDVTPAPSLSWLGLVGIDIRRAVDEHGQHLTQSHVQPEEADPNGIYFDGGMGMQMFQRAMVFRQGGWQMDSYLDPLAAGNPRHVPVSLLVGTRPSKTLRELEGVVTARVLTPPQPLITVDDVLKVSGGTQFRSGSMTLQVLDAKVQPSGRVQLRAHLETTSMMANEFMQMGVRVRGRLMPFLAMNQGYPAAATGMPQFTLFDAAGKPFRQAQQNHTSSTDNGITLTQEMQFVFSPDQGQKPPFRLVLTGRRAGDVDVPFVLKNVPLP